jgi:hypothetical protein
MTLAHEDDEDAQNNRHPYWYAQVLGIFHVNARLSESTEAKPTNFLWVRWFGRDPDHTGGFETRRFHRIGLMELNDPSSYEFLNPSDVLRAVHLIPAFSLGRLLPDPEADEDSMDWQFYYVSMYVDPFFTLHVLTDI